MNCGGPRLLPSPALTGHTRTRIYTVHPHTQAAQCAHPLSTHGQTFTQVPPGFDGWSARALPPVSYTYNLILRRGEVRTQWVPHQTGLIEAVKLSYPLPLPSLVTSIMFRCLANMYDCSLLIKSYILPTRKKNRGKAFGCIIYLGQFLMCLAQSGGLSAS